MILLFPTLITHHYTHLSPLELAETMSHSGLINLEMLQGVLKSCGSSKPGFVDTSDECNSRRPPKGCSPALFLQLTSFTRPSCKLHHHAGCRARELTWQKYRGFFSYWVSFVSDQVAEPSELPCGYANTSFNVGHICIRKGIGPFSSWLLLPLVRGNVFPFSESFLHEHSHGSGRSPKFLLREPSEICTLSYRHSWSFLLKLYLGIFFYLTHGKKPRCGPGGKWVLSPAASS